MSSESKQNENIKEDPPDIKVDKPPINEDQPSIDEQNQAQRDEQYQARRDDSEIERLISLENLKSVLSELAGISETRSVSEPNINQQLEYDLDIAENIYPKRFISDPELYLSSSLSGSYHERHNERWTPSHLKVGSEISPKKSSSDEIDPKSGRKRIHELAMTETPRDRINVLCIAAFLLTIMILVAVVGYRAVRSKPKVILHENMKIYIAAAIVSDAAPCAAIAKKVLSNGGSAVDGAIATMFCSEVYSLQSSGFGGGFFLTYYNRTESKAYSIDAQGTAPSKVTINLLHAKQNSSKHDGLNIAVPGGLKGLWLASMLYGRAQWKELVQPAITMCEDGYEMGPRTAESLTLVESIILESKSLRKIFVNESTRKLKVVGDKIRLPELAKTLRIIAEKGVDEFYKGSLGEKFLKDIKENEGVMLKSDLRNYKARRKKPAFIKLNKGLRMYSSPPPGSGYLLAYILSVMEDISPEKNISALFYHRSIEVYKQTFRYKNSLGDEGFENIFRLVGELTSQKMIQKIQKLIDDKKIHPLDYNFPRKEASRMDQGSSHLCIIDEYGDAVVVSSTTNSLFGSKIVSKSTGIIANDNIKSFSEFKDTIPNKNILNPGKRPMSFLSPTIIVNAKGDVVMAIAASTGAKILTSMALVIFKTLMYGIYINQSVNDCRVHHQINPDVLQYEKGFPTEILHELTQLGHQVVEMDEKEKSNVFAIFRDEEKYLHAIYDIRTEGSISGIGRTQVS